tara:strand:- start:210 stop:1238 length:1029 start_codon:yes stop_codon:yes gene_type:complete
MSKVLKIEKGSYTVKVESGNEIILDTSRNNDVNNRPSGKVVVRGNLEVEGNTTTVESTQVTINDNILTLNHLADFESAVAGIPSTLNGQGGLNIERGTNSTAQFLFDENITWSVGSTSGTGTFRFKTAAGQELPLYTPGIKGGGTIYLDPGTGTISVTNTTDYEKKVFTYTGSNIVDSGGGVVIDSDNIPNAQAVVDYVQYYVTTSSPTSSISNFNTSLTTSDFQGSGQPSQITGTIDGNSRFVIYDDRTEFNTAVKISSNEISSVATNADLKLSANGTGDVLVNDILRIAESSDPATPTASVRLYSKSPAAGATGLYYINKNGNNDELISKRRAILYSLIL